MGGGKNLAAGKKKTLFFCAVSRIRDSVLFLSLDPDMGSGMEKNPDPVSGIRDEHLGSYF
jgi:hypothetical protein